MDNTPPQMLKIRFMVERLDQGVRRILLLDLDYLVHPFEFNIRLLVSEFIF